MRLSRTNFIRENLIYLAIWVVLFVAPLISLMAHAFIDEHIVFRWNTILRIWALYLAYLVVFLIHNFLLAPILVYKKRKRLYFACLSCLMALFVVYQCANDPGRGHDKHRPPMHENMPPPMAEGQFGDMPRPFDAPEEKPQDEPAPPPMSLGLEQIFSFVLVCMMLGVNIAIKRHFKNEQERKTLEELEKENLRQRLDYLKYQINPHFFMNTLNNIHALVDIDPVKAQEAIVLLSKIMRYVLYEGERHGIPIHREVEFIGSYISLMRLRYSSQVDVDFKVGNSLTEGEIPPLLLITFVENAFKHGISYRQPSFVKIDISEHDGCLVFTCRNSKPPKPAKTISSEGGVGLKNVRQRLALLYDDDYTLEIDDQKDEYTVVLTLKKLSLNND